jgi:putative ABC transport system permease protein
VSLWRQLQRGVRALTNRAAADQDTADEVEDFFEQATEALEASGLSPAEARRRARLDFGSTLAVREQVRASRWEHLVETLFADLRYGARRLRASPGFAVVSAITVALGIGASTAIFSAVYPVLFEPLPYPAAGRLVMIWDSGRDGSRNEVTFATYRELLQRTRSFESIAVMKPWGPTLTGSTEPERLDGQRVSVDYFRALGPAPVLGRNFEAADDRLNGPRVVVLSHALWRRRFNSDPAILGRHVTLDDNPYTVVGVMPATFENVLLPSAQLWTPLQYDVSLPIQGPEWGHHLRLVGRLNAGVGFDQAAVELGSIARTPARDFTRPRWASLENGLSVDRLQDDVIRSVKPALTAVVGAVLILLMITGVNVTNLVLARSSMRSEEFAMRVALGAARTRLLRQLVTEGLLLAAVGGGLGIVLAVVGVPLLVALIPPELPRSNAIAVDGAVILFASGLTMLIGLILGVVPASNVLRADAHAGWQQHLRRSVGGRRQWTRRVLVVVEVALAVVLTVSAGLLLRSLQRLFAVDPGFEAARLLTVQVQVSGHRFSNAATTHQFFSEALEAVRRVPGVAAAALTSQLPLSGDQDLYGAQFESRPLQRADESRGTFRYAVSPGYFETLGIRLREGRLLDARDVAGSPLAVVINESFARRRFPGQDAIGQRLHVGPQSGPRYTVVGIVSDVKQMSLGATQEDAVYLTPTQWHFADNPQWFVIRALSDPTALAPAVREAIWSVDKNQPIVRVATMDDLLAATAADRRFALKLFAAFGVVAIVLAAIGIYGLLAGSVAERRREIGVRSALGATRARIVGMVVRQGMSLMALGAGIGLIGAVAASGALVGLLFGVSRLDPAAYLGVVTLLASVSAIACCVPAWRAARVDPAITLRTE